MLYLDLESRSQVSLPSDGLLRYAQDTTTEVICMSYAFDDGPVDTWFAEDGPMPTAVLDYIANTDGPITAHNAAFERHLFDFVISNDYDFEPPTLTRWQCSSARAMAHGVPGSLGNACRALKLPMQKQSEGTRLIRDYCAPFFKTDWTGNDRQLMQDYCEMDVLTMRQLCSVLRQLEPEEWHQYHVTEKMNDRGVPLDIAFANAALEYAGDIRADVSRRLSELTGGRVVSAAGRKARDAWLREQLTDEQLETITVEVGGTEKIKFDKEYRALLLKAPGLPSCVDQLIELVEQAGGSTISKYKSMVNTHVEGRVHGSLVWNGAGATGRFSSRGLQLQNFRRDVFDDPEPTIAAVLDNVPIDRPADALGRLIRSTIYSSKGLTFSDYSQIEARVLPWLTNSQDAEKTLDVFRGGRDLYSENALGMFGVGSVEEVTPELRQAAKVAVLAGGFGGGKGALLSMARMYGMRFTEEEAQDIVTRWRTSNPWATPFWYGLKEASRAAVQMPKVAQHHGKMSFLYDGKDWLWMRLPSGRCLAYFAPRFELVEYPWGDEGWELTCLWGSAKPKAGAKWPRRVLSHLILSENATQGTAADVMRETIVRAEDAGLDALFSVHDELVIEGHAPDLLHDVMITAPAWAGGLPLAAETQTSNRYGK